MNLVEGIDGDGQKTRKVQGSAATEIDRQLKTSHKNSPGTTLRTVCTKGHSSVSWPTQMETRIARSLEACFPSQKGTTSLLHSQPQSHSLENRRLISLPFLFPRANLRPSALKIRLVGQHSLWAHHLWNAAKVLADYFGSHPEVVEGKTVLELGAAGALPSFTAACNGAEKVFNLLFFIIADRYNRLSRYRIS